ncbi:MAG: hypothetical protein LBI77_02860 [Puniceicoccales bacterium]|jgi:pullulanase/glycogen debranching enzyme|nr:hypothetical protein [Puniceicoccales bacterium]
MEKIEVVCALWLDEKSGLLFIDRNREFSEVGGDFGDLIVNGEKKKVRFSPAAEFEVAEMFGYYEKSGKIIFLWDEKNKKGSDFHLAGDINRWLSEGLDFKWKLKPRVIQGRRCSTLSIPKSELPEYFQFKFVSQRWEWQPLPQCCPNAVTSAPGLVNLEYRAEKTGRHVLKFFLENSRFNLGDSAVFLRNDCRVVVDDTRLLQGLYSDEKLGAWVENHWTHFALFAPRISAAEVLWKRDFDGAYQRQLMIKKENGIWATSVNADLSDCYYLFCIQKPENGPLISREIADPYARALVGKNGPGIIVKSVEMTHHFQPPPLEKLVIYEAHVRDLIAHVPEISESEKGGFSGLEKFLDLGYFKKLGINAVELQPIQEFDGEKKEDYHWGYMPVNYFAPASAYGSGGQKGSQVREFYQLVEAFHRQKIAIILDVVYNHVGEPNYLHMIDPKYFFRQNDGGFLLNYSGCGNDLCTENPMVRKLIIDSLEHFVRTYDVDGFRFDLAELVGLEFLDEVRLRLQKIKPSIIMIAEPWSFRSYAGHELRKTKLLGWNDEYREFIRDYVLGNGNCEGLSYFMEGSLKFRSQFSAQSVNYLSSHDDFCWIDRITENANHDGFRPTLVDMRRTHMALAILLLSLGVPMLGAGMELLHSKRGVHNTYRRGDLNALDYSRALEYPLTLKYVQQLLHLRRESRLLCLENVPSENYIRLFNGVEKNAAAVILFNATLEMGSEQILFAVNPYFEKAHFDLGILPNSGFSQIADTFSFQKEFNPPYLWKEKQLELPPLSCGIWRRLT